MSNVPGGGLLVAVDGPSGTGKSTTCRALAKRLGATYVDTGAMYRIATLAVLRAGVDPQDAGAVAQVTANLDLEVSDDPDSTAVLLAGEDVSEKIRGAEVTGAVSAVSAPPEVREILVGLQRELAIGARRAVVEGRDIGTVVLAGAPAKIFLTASAEVRARRRLDQDLAAGRQTTFEEVLAQVNARDAADSSRAASPLKPAGDAVIVDTSQMSPQQVEDRLVEIVLESAGGLPEAAGSDNADTAASPDAADEGASSAGGPEDGELDAPTEFIQAGFDDAATWGSDEFDLSDADAEELAGTDWQEVEEAFGIERHEEEHLCTVAIVGRPNVGKSSLVNRFLGRREAVVEDTPGVTRDRVSYLAEWNGKRFWVQDTGGWDPNVKGIHAAIARQAESAMASADVIVMVVDSRVGITETDEVMARRLQRSDVPVVLVANKVDSPMALGDVAELYALGLGYPWPVSALHGRGGADVLDEILRVFPAQPRQSSITSGPRRVALVGRPNVGKSSLLNKLASEERSVVDNVAGTTVDPVDSLVQLDKKLWRFVDTAGLRRKVKRAQGHEFYASLRTNNAIESAEVCIMLIDASEPVSEQDQRILSQVIDSGKALVLAFNKWDLVDEDRRVELEREIDLQLAHLPWVTRVNISAMTGRAVQKLEPAMLEALASWDQRVSTGRLNNWMREAIAQNPPPMKNNRLPRVLFATQASTRPPTVVLFTTGFLDAGYRRYLERKFREEFGFHGTPVRIAVRVRERRSKK
ncbi:hypothetical protein CATYP_05585 [Corynebacterium atypicum]|uniref:Multifunctional fusion protein n=1 Tax=Corynebacterium atypicum TaxID=191610 RepID=A0ABM5QMV5_9CORY|nr:hypothetical protein CATYP_05585 [Corynebacterium atypicum]